MNNEFDELAKRLAQSTTRRQALKKFGVGLAGMALACFGLADRTAAQSKKKTGYCQIQPGLFSPSSYTGLCVDPTTCQTGLSNNCKPGKSAGFPPLSFACGSYYDSLSTCAF